MARMRLSRILPVRNRRAHIRLLIRQRLQSLAPRRRLPNPQVRKGNPQVSIVARSRRVHSRAVGTQRRRRRSHGKSVCAEEFSKRENRAVAQKSRPKIRPGKRAEVQYYERRMRQKVMRARDLLSRVD